MTYVNELGPTESLPARQIHNQLNWSKHIDHLSTKLSSIMFVCRTLVPILGREIFFKSILPSSSADLSTAWGFRVHLLKTS